VPTSSFFFTLALSFAGGLPLTAQTSKVQNGRVGYDIVLFVLDDVAAAALALYGGPVVTPHLAKLAEEGVLFTNAYANPVCATTRRAIQFGRWWLRGNGEACTSAVSPDTPRLEELTLAEALPAHTAAFIGKWHLGASRDGSSWECAPLGRGYEFWRAGLPSNVIGDLFCTGSIGYRDWLRVEAGPEGCSASLSSDYHPRAVLDSFVELWPTMPRPRLACVNSNLAHAPFHRPPADMLPAGYPPTTSDRARFEAMITALDSNLGRMLAEIDLATTLVAVIGDNGTPDVVAPEPERAKNTTFERGIRVPLILAGGPTRMVGRREQDLVHAVDLWSTLVEAGGGDPRSPTSRSLLPVLRSKVHSPVRDAVLCGTLWSTRRGDRCAISARGLKLRQLDFDGDEIVDLEELYDLGSDPLERTNLITAKPAAAAALRQWIEAESP